MKPTFLKRIVGKFSPVLVVLLCASALGLANLRRLRAEAVLRAQQELNLVSETEQPPQPNTGSHRRRGADAELHLQRALAGRWAQRAIELGVTENELSAELLNARDAVPIIHVENPPSPSAHIWQPRAANAWASLVATVAFAAYVGFALLFLRERRETEDADRKHEREQDYWSMAVALAVCVLGLLFA